MHATLPLLEQTEFPTIKRGQLDTLQVNLGYKCNQQCLHCHVNASPQRKEVMDSNTVDQVIAFMKNSGVNKIDLTGGAPELNPHFKKIVIAAVSAGIRVLDRCNLTILEEPGYQDMAQFLADHNVEIIASLPCYSEANVNEQRGKGVFAKSIRSLKKLNDIGYARAGSELVLNLVYNPIGPTLPPGQKELEAEYKKKLFDDFQIEFNELFTLANMPIKRFGSTLVSKGQFEEYMLLLKNAHSAENLKSVMCRTMVSIDWQGYVYDCDFNQMLGLSLGAGSKSRLHINELSSIDLEGKDICIKDHCYGCTAGQGSSCGGALS